MVFDAHDAPISQPGGPCARWESGLEIAELSRGVLVCEARTEIHRGSTKNLEK
jgi:hypothetical protein